MDNNISQLSSQLMELHSCGFYIKWGYNEMIGENNWFREYQMLSEDEKELYREFILDEEQKIRALDYERFKSAIGLISSAPSDLLLRYNNTINVAEEVALIFDDECVYVALYLKNERCINEQVYDMIMQINEELESLSGEHNTRNWTIQAMNNDRRWIKARELANKVLWLLNSNM